MLQMAPAMLRPVARYLQAMPPMFRRPSKRTSWMASRLIFAILSLATMLVAKAARAEDLPRETPPAEFETNRVAWTGPWARFRPWEYAVTSAVMTEAFLMRFVGPDPPKTPNKTRIDVDITDSVDVNGKDRDMAKLVGDIGYFGSMAYRFVDSAILPAVIWGSPDVAWQMSWIDLESFAIVAGVLWNVQLVVGRERPGYRKCPHPPVDRDFRCDDTSGNRYRGFIAGHVAVAAAGAGVTCLHHSHLPLYGGGFGDEFACAATIGATAAVGGARLIGQEHYASDVLLGGALGVFAGYIVPSALHYGFTSRGVVDAPQAAQRTIPIRVSLLPLVTPSTFGAAAVGLF